MSQAPKLSLIFPTFVVPDVRATVAYYRDALGFRPCTEAGTPPNLFAIVESAPGQGFHFKHSASAIGRKNRADGGDQLDAYVRIGRGEDVDRLSAALTKGGAARIAAPIDRPWKMRELELVDPNGFALCFAGDLAGEATPGTIVVSPQFVVRDVAKTAAWYQDVLGFRTLGQWGEPPEYAIVARDDVRVHLGRAAEGARIRKNRDAAEIWDAYVECRGMDALHDAFRGRGATIVRGPQNAEYDMRELVVRTPDGHDLCFGEPVIASR